MELRILIDNRGKQFTGISRDKLGYCQDGIFNHLNGLIGLLLCVLFDALFNVLTLMALPICLERIFICSITLIMQYNARFSSLFEKNSARWSPLAKLK